MDLTSPYLTRQIIAYIGNKRRLLPLLHSALMDVYGEIPAGKKFLDLFAGSGSVSRLAKFLGFEVIANDWEPYACTIGRGYVGTDLRDIPLLFGTRRGFEDLLAHLNNLPDPVEDDCYIARYYAPRSRSVDEADFRTERLFYTRENALAIDKIRSEIARIYPDSDENATAEDRQRRDILVSLLLYGAATHTNTSGVFKACHKGFGGHGGDALTRILAPIRLSNPPLIDSDYPCSIYREDAGSFVRRPEARGVEVAYLDPPYNQHQYGSNYHLLNSIALWDKVPAPLDLTPRGVLKEKAAIRKDWVRTRSDYCYADKAEEAFAALIRDLDAETVLVSYSTDGIIPFSRLREICEDRGDLSIVTNEYTKYRGGKQSNSRLNVNVEFVLIVRTGRRSASKKGHSDIDKILLLREVRLLLRRRYRRRLLEENFRVSGMNSLTADLPGRVLEIPLRNPVELVPPEDVDGLSSADLSALCGRLKASLCRSKEDELEEIFSLLSESGKQDVKKYVKMIPGTLRKLAHKKNRGIFSRWLEAARGLEVSHPEAYALIHEELTALETVARRRFEN